MKKYLLISAVFIGTTVSGQKSVVYGKDLPIGFAERKIARSEMAEDILFWLKVMEESHVNLYHAIGRDALTKMGDSLLSQFSDSLTQKQCLLLMGQMAAALEEGHLGLPFSKATDSLYINSLRFPYILKAVTQDSWLVERDISENQQLGPNARILEINGITTSELTKKFLTYYGGLPNWRLQQVRTNARKLLYLHGFESPFRIKAVTENGKEVSFITLGFSLQQADSINKVLAKENKNTEPYQLNWKENNIAYLSYKSMVNAASNPFPEFLEKSFTEIKKRNAAGIVIDLRQNGGGNSEYGVLLLSYLTQIPYRLAGGMKWKISSHYKEYLSLLSKQDNKPSNADNTFYLSMKDGETYSYENTQLIPPSENPLRYQGKVAILIGPNTFSSANMLADGVKSYHLAVLFGEPTGESGNDFGEMFDFLLPNSYIVARGSTKMFKRADGNEKDLNPVYPDFRVLPGNLDKEQKDTVLEAALTWILLK